MVKVIVLLVMVIHGILFQKCNTLKTSTLKNKTHELKRRSSDGDINM